MEAKISIEQKDTVTWQVTVSDADGSESQHDVGIPANYVESLGWGSDAASVKELLNRSFEFLLAREPKESILSSFELNVIENYFPEYRKEIGE